MQDFEKLGSFYLGKRVDGDEVTDDLVLYDSKDLTTHAVIIGMTGSGKTGLGIGMIEEAALDNIPVIAIDPKGDLGNLLLTFPGLKPADFEPWVNPSEAANKGMSVPDFAKGQAELWKKGLKSWGQSGARIKKMRGNVEMAVYTPGSTAGLPVSVLESFAAPPESLQKDRDLYRDRVQATATSILALLGVNADPVTSREHILISNILDHFWAQSQSLDIAGLIGQIQNPPITRIGVLELDQFYPATERFGLAMQLNNLLGAPGFEAWMQGAPLSAKNLLYTETGKPKISVMSIAHLPDAERMFFVCMLLNEIISWMRAQPGTSSLRAILYMDEIFGYIPPIANPPSKRLFLTLLKQARAYGLGLVLSTQNPVDLDYKGLSNTGTWMIGRVQTERDKARVMEGLEGVAAGAEFDRAEMERTLAGLGKRRFLLHNVHESQPVVFNTRWAMSYLAGPLTRDQIRTLMDKPKATAEKAAAISEPPVRIATAAVSAAPRPPAGVKQFWLTADADDDEELVYLPCVVGASELNYSNSRYKVEAERECLALVEPSDSAVPVDWDEAETPAGLTIDNLQKKGRDSAEYGELPSALSNAKNYGKWTATFKRWLRNEQTMSLYRSAVMKQTSEAGESEAEFRIRLNQLASEQRDLTAAKLKQSYGKKITTLENRLLRAEQAIERETEQSTKKKLDVAVSFGAAILGAFLGRKRVTASSASKIGTAVRSAGGIRKEASDVARATETAERVRAELAELNEQFQAEIDALDGVYNAQTDELEEILIKPKSTDIEIHFVSLAWIPYTRDAKGRLRIATNY